MNNASNTTNALDTTEYLNSQAIDSFVAQVKFNADGLVTAIAQDSETGEVLMLAWQNEESLRQTLASGKMVYFSRSRQKLWHKGETSGYTQTVNNIMIDCDGDAVLAKVTQYGGIACHTGRKSCFYKEFSRELGILNNAPVLKNPKEIY